MNTVYETEISKESHRRLIDASLMGLGVLLTKSEEGVEDPIVYNMAIALKLNGVQSSYIEEIIIHNHKKGNYIEKSKTQNGTQQTH